MKIKYLYLLLSISLVSVNAQTKRLIQETDATTPFNTNDYFFVEQFLSGTNWGVRRASFSQLQSGLGYNLVNVKNFGAKGDGTTDDTAALISAFGSTSGTTNSWIYIPNGTYKITHQIQIKSNTRLTLDKGAMLLRGASIDNILINLTNTLGNYDSSSNIVVEGGIFEANSGSFGGDSTLLAFGHCNNITIQNVVFQNLQGNWHFLELNAVRHAYVNNCVFTNRTLSEAFQLDIMADASAFPWFGPYDNTPCEDIHIDNCYFQNVEEGVGSHRWAANKMIHDVTIRNCTFTNFTGVAIRGYNWSGGIIIDGNYFFNGHRAVDTDIEAFNEDIDPGFRRTGWRVINNNIYNMTNDTSQSRGIKVKWINDVQINGNYITNCSRHGIGVDWPCANFTVANNIISSCGQLASTGRGIYVFGAFNGNVTGNVITNCYDGAIQIGGSGGIPVSSNVVVSLNIAPKDGCRIETCDRVGIFNNRFIYDITNSSSSNIYTNGNFY